LDLLSYNSKSNRAPNFNGYGDGDDDDNDDDDKGNDSNDDVVKVILYTVNILFAS